MLDSQRHKELSGMTPGRSREDKIILLNIKGKEKDNSKVNISNFVLFYQVRLKSALLFRNRLTCIDCNI
jgi:hypothetical protein